MILKINLGIWYGLLFLLFDATLQNPLQTFSTRVLKNQFGQDQFWVGKCKKVNLSIIFRKKIICAKHTIYDDQKV